MIWVLIDRIRLSVARVPLSFQVYEISICCWGFRVLECGAETKILSGSRTEPWRTPKTHDEYLLERRVTAGLRESGRLKGSSTDVLLVVTVWYIDIYVFSPQKQFLSLFILNTTCWKHNRITLHLLLSTKDKEKKREQAKKGCGEREKERDEGSGEWKCEALGKRGRRIWHRAGLAVLRRSVTAKRFSTICSWNVTYAKPFQLELVSFPKDSQLHPMLWWSNNGSPKQPGAHGCFDIRLGDDLNIEDSRSIYKEQTRASNFLQYKRFAEFIFVIGISYKKWKWGEGMILNPRCFRTL